MWILIVTAVVLDGLLVLGAARYFERHPIHAGDRIRPIKVFGRFQKTITFLFNFPHILSGSSKANSQSPIQKAETSKKSRVSQAWSLPINIADRGRQFLASLSGAVATVNLPFVLALVLAILPPIVIFCYRWLKLSEWISFGSVWANLPAFISHLAYPDYFWVVIACFLGLLILTIFFKKDADLTFFTTTDSLESHPTITGRYKLGEILFLGAILYFVLIAGQVIIFHATPGIDLILCLLFLGLGAILREIDLTSIISWMQANIWFGLAMLLTHVSLVFLLVQLNSLDTFQWWPVLLFILSVLNLLRFHARIPKIFWIVNLAMALFSIYINAWWYAFIGDEYAFYYGVMGILQSSSLHEVLSQMLNGTYVYGAHPYFSSVIQAISMKLLGVNGIGWRFSNVYLSAIAIFFFYSFLRRFLTERLATITACMLACSQYLISFGKIGYNNLQGFFMLCVVLWVAGWAAQARRPLAFTMLGFSLAGCFYVFPGALFAIPIGIFIPLFFGVSPRQSNWRLWLHMLIPFVMLVFPLLFQPDYWITKTTGIFLPNSSQASFGIIAVLGHLASNTIYSLFSFLYRVGSSHYVALSYMDLVSCTFIFLGLVAMLSQVFRQRFAAFWMVTFGYMVVGVGATHQYDFPPPTRMFMLLPWFCLLAACGLEWVLVKASKIGWVKNEMGLVTGFCLLIILTANLLQIQMVSVPEAKADASAEGLFLRTAERSITYDPNDWRIYIILTPPNIRIDNMKLIQTVYNEPRPPAQMVQMTVEGSDLSPDVREMLKNQKTVVVLRRDADWKIPDRVVNEIQQTGRISCEISGEMNSYAYWVLWFTPGQDALCW